MSRKEPSVSSFDLPVATQSVAGAPAPARRLHDRLRFWLFLLTEILAAAMGLGAFAVRADWDYVKHVRHPEYVLPLCVFCVIAGLAALRRGWPGVTLVVVAATSVAVYLAAATQHLTGGFFFALFVAACGLVSANSLRSAAV